MKSKNLAPRFFSLFILALSLVGGSSMTPPPAQAAVQLMFPVADTRITSGFGLRVHPITHAEDFHTGLDLAATLNQRVHTVVGCCGASRRARIAGQCS